MVILYTSVIKITVGPTDLVINNNYLISLGKIHYFDH